MTNAPDDAESTGSAVNPYQASVAPSAESSAGNQKRPSGVSWFGIVGCIAGCLACLGCLMGLVGTVVNTFMQAPAAGQAGATAADAMNAAAAEVQQKYIVVTVVFLVLLGVAGILMLVGAIQLLSGKNGGRVLLRRVYFFMCFFEIARLVPFVMSQLEMMPVMKQFMQELANEQQSGAPQEMMVQVGQVTLITVMVFSGLWALVKFVFYLWGAIYLNSEPAKQYCKSA